MPTFDQRNQKVIYQYNAAGNINFDSVQNKTDLVIELQKLEEELHKAIKDGALNEEVAIDVESKLKKTILQTQKTEPNKKTILDNLREAHELIAGFASAAGLVKGLAEAAEMVKKLL